MINVLMIDGNDSIVRAVREYFSNQKSIHISKVCSNGNDAAGEIFKDCYDVILMDPIISGIDGIGLLKLLKNSDLEKNVIIYTNQNNENMIKKVAQYNVSFFLMKPTNMDVLSERIVDATKLKFQDFEVSDNDILLEISKLLHDLGMPSHIKGYQYIREAIELIYNNPDYLRGITKNLYPFIANKYGTTSSRVERAIRHAIEISWNRGDYDLMDEIFGHSVDFDRDKPTNSEFLATLADKITLENNKK